MNDKLIKYITEKKLSINRLSIITGISMDNLNEILSNSRKATFNEMGRIASKLQVTLDVISNDEDITNADVHIVSSKELDKKILGLSKVSFVFVIIAIIIVVYICSGFVFTKIVRIECSYKDSYLKEELKYSLTTRDIKLYRAIKVDGNEYNKVFYDIHYKQVKKNYHNKCTVKKIKGMSWKYGGVKQ